MSEPDIPFRIETVRKIEHDGSRRAIADGRIVRLPRRQAPGLEQALAEAVNELPVTRVLEESGRQAWQQRGVPSCT